MVKFFEKDGEYFLNIVCDGMDDMVFLMSDSDRYSLMDSISYTYHKEDVINYIKENNLELEDEVVKKITNTYHNLRENNDGDEYGMSWSTCLEKSFKKHGVEIEEIEKDYE